jgi:outer membrane protein assembly factor BamB
MFKPFGPRATPTVDGDRIYILSQTGDFVCFTTEGKEVWRVNYAKDFGGIMPVWGFGESPLIDGDKIICTPGAEDATMMALDKATGKQLWMERDAPKGALTLADGRLYLRTERGAMILIEPNREKFIERGRFEQPDRTREPAWAHPVIANGKMYVRDQDVLLCYDVKAK